jgi:hypothetical protein
MRADVYQKLHEFNLHIDQGVATLRSMAKVKGVAAGEINRLADYFEEIRTSASGYLTGIVAADEEREAGHLFGTRRRREMAEDPMHGGWLEEERERKRLAELRSAKATRKKKAGAKNHKKK